jgi:hypothetical protein
MSRHPRLVIVTLGLMIVGAAFAQNSDKPSTADQKRTIRVGIATTANRSSRQVTPTWARDQLVRELQRMRSDRKSQIVLDVVSLDATEREDASAEAEKKRCQFFVLTTVVNPNRGPGITGGPDGMQRAPVMIGNTNPNQTIGVDFAVLEVGTARTVTEGTATAPVESNNDIRASDDAMRFVAHRVASELRKLPSGFD